MRWSALLAFALLGCGSSESPELPVVADSSTSDVALTDTYVVANDAEADGPRPDAPVDAGPPGLRFVGRFESESAASAFAWSGSAFHFRFTGTGVKIRFDGPANQFALVVDGGAPTTFKTTAGNNTYTLLSGLTAGTHEVWLQRRTEAFFGEIRYRGISVDGGELLPPPPAPDRRIEIIGDSITCGYGNEGADQYCGFTADTENHYATYGSIAARTLGADLHSISWSGIGMYRNYDGMTTGTMPERWGRTLPQKDASVWMTDRYVPHAVVINLGTNDFAKGDPGSAFVTAYTTFVRRVRTAYPAAWIFPSVGPMLSGTSLTSAKNHLNAVITTLAGEGDTKLSLIEFATQSGSDGYGCDWHPSLATNAKMAKVLETALKAKLGW